MDRKIRLQKFIAQTGLCSRRKAEELIQQGLVSVNGKIITEMGTKVDPDKDRVRFQGKQIGATARTKVAFLLYKPKGYLTTLSDPLDRPTIKDLTKKIPGNLFPIGRLDFNSEGLLILTNDGDLAHAITHPSHKIEKIYLVKVKGVPTKATLHKLRKGVELEDGITAPCQVNLVSSAAEKSWLEIVLNEGRNKQIRRMGDAVGHPVLKLKRIGIAFLTAEGLKHGQYRRLKPQEIDLLKEMAQGKHL